MSSVCTVHGVEASGVCTRCGRFGCASCLVEELCAECRARPEVRLTPSPEARRALWMALLGFHGVVVLLPFAFWFARAELQAITRGDSPPAGRPWAQGALMLSALGSIGWLIALAAWLR